MGFSIEIGTNIKYTDGTGTHYLFEGDRVACHVGGKVYNGTISLAGTYKEPMDPEPRQVICLNTSKNKTSLSSEIINLKDITGICRDQFSHGKNMPNNVQRFVGLFMERGYSREKAESIYNRMEEAVAYYNIPVVKAAAYAMRAVGYLNNNRAHGDTRDKKAKLAGFAKECADMAAKEYFKMLDMHIRSLERDGLDTVSCISDTLEIVSKCWDDLERQRAGEAADICGD